MRRYAILAATAFGVLTFAGGCRREMIPDPPAAVSKNAKPTAPDLVAYLNHNAQLVQSMSRVHAGNGRPESLRISPPPPWLSACSKVPSMM